MKKLVCLILVTVFMMSVVLVCTSCSSYDLVICNWGEYICDSDEGEMFDVIKRFEEEYGVKVKYVTAETTEELYSLMKTGGVDYDVIFPSDYMIEQMISEGMLAKINFDLIPNFSNIMEEYVNPAYDPTNEYSVPYFWGTVGIIYNKTLVKEPVDSWDDLWSPDYPNMVLMFSNPRDAFAIALNKLGYSMNTVNEAQIKEAAEELKKQKFVYSMDQFFDLMPSGSAVMAPYYAGDYLYVLEENPDLEFVRPESGTNIFSDAMCIPATSRHQDLAAEFINFMLRPDVGKCNTEYVGYSTPNTKVWEILDEDMKNNPIAYPEIDPKWEAYEALPANINALMNELWIEILAANG